MYYFYWLPMGTDAKVRGIPWITWSLLVANVVVFAALNYMPGAEAFAYRLAFKASHPTVQTALASLFIHAGPLQLLANMLFLACFGPPLESRLGPSRYLIAFLACGWISNLAQAAWIANVAPELGLLPIIGAAGAISGLMGFFLVRLPFAQLRFASVSLVLLQGVLRSGRQTLPALAGVGAWFLIQILASLRETLPEVVLIGHLCGLLAGLLFAWGLGFIAQGRLESLLAAGSRYASRGEWFAALSEYEAYLALSPDDPEGLTLAARIERVVHQESRAAESFRLAIRNWLRRGGTREACDAYAEMKRLLGDSTLPPGDLLRVARGCEELGRPGEASRAYEAYGRDYPDRENSTVALLKSAEIEQRVLGNPGRANYLYEELLRRPLEPDLERVVRERAGLGVAAAPRERIMA